MNAFKQVGRLVLKKLNSKADRANQQWIETVKKTREFEQLPAPSSSRPPLVVSLTTYGSRIQTVHLAIRSMLMQTVLPNRVVLYLDKDSNDVELPIELLRLQEYGLDIRKGYENLHQQTKYFYAMQEFPDSDILTIDDDAIYASDTIESLVASRKEFPGCVSARRVHRIKLENGQVAQYSKWENEFKEKSPRPRHSLLATGIGGVLYPMGIMPEETFNAELIRDLGCYGDDLWLKVFEVRNNISVVWAPNSNPHPFTIEGTQENASWIEYVDGGRNDIELKLLMDHFAITPEAFED